MSDHSDEDGDYSSSLLSPSTTLSTGTAEPCSSKGGPDYATFRTNGHVVATGRTTSVSRKPFVFYSDGRKSVKDALHSCSDYQILNLLRTTQPLTTDEEASKWATRANKRAGQSKGCRGTLSLLGKTCPQFVHLSMSEAKTVLTECNTKRYLWITENDIDKEAERRKITLKKKDVARQEEREKSNSNP